VFVGTGVSVGVAVGIVVEVGSGVAVTGIAVAVTTMTTGLGVGVVPQDVRKRTPRTTTPKMIAGLTISEIDLLFNNFFMPCPSLRAEVLAVLCSYRYYRGKR
jgi:hypothetical protein